MLKMVLLFLVFKKKVKLFLIQKQIKHISIAIIFGKIMVKMENLVVMVQGMKMDKVC